MKDILSKKRTVEDNETIALTREYSAVIKKLPPKLRDPGRFSIPCVIGKETIEKATCDLGASVSLLPLSLFKRMGIVMSKTANAQFYRSGKNRVSFRQGVVQFNQLLRDD